MADPGRTRRARVGHSYGRIDAAQNSPSWTVTKISNRHGHMKNGESTLVQKDFLPSTIDSCLRVNVVADSAQRGKCGDQLGKFVSKCESRGPRVDVATHLQVSEKDLGFAVAHLDGSCGIND